MHGKHMKLWGMLSNEDESAGFEVVLDKDWFLLINKNGETRARLDPSIYTLPQLRAVVECLLQLIRGNQTTDNDLSDSPGMPISELSFLAMLKFSSN